MCIHHICTSHQINRINKKASKPFLIVSNLLFVVTSLSSFASATSFVTRLDATSYWRVDGGTRLLNSPDHTSAHSSVPVVVGVALGQRLPLNERFYLGGEIDAQYLGFDRFTYQGEQISQHLFQFTGFGTLTGFVNPHLEFHGKLGVASQLNFNQSTDYGFGIAASVGTGIYINPLMQITFDVQHTFGGANAYPYGHGTLANTAFTVGLQCFF
ncbi:hypothetical protein [Cysteiniphilum sp. 6C5]|uniref:hypothetical protein n=1 Tax=unclassified Cysteiniphilum TaxID=2610889 RepID=UPI003F875927